MANPWYSQTNGTISGNNWAFNKCHYSFYDYMNAYPRYTTTNMVTPFGWYIYGGGQRWSTFSLSDTTSNPISTPTTMNSSLSYICVRVQPWYTRQYIHPLQYALLSRVTTPPYNDGNSYQINAASLNDLRQNQVGGSYNTGNINTTVLSTLSPYSFSNFMADVIGTVSMGPVKTS